MNNMTFFKTVAVAFVVTGIAVTLVSRPEHSDAQQPAVSTEQNKQANIAVEIEAPDVENTALTGANGAPSIQPFLDLAGSRRLSEHGVTEIEQHPHPGNAIMLLESLSYIRNQGVVDRVARLLAKDTGVRRPPDTDDWYHAIWRMDYKPNPDYAAFKSQMYRNIDPRFAEYFDNNREATIRLDEVRWGGVVRDGIPPLKDPDTLTTDEATYLNDDDVIFGVVLNGEARAYPKRILAWHEMVKDTVGGTPINGVYCTLCGSMIVYFPKDQNGVHHELGTSGFLYRSNKLMYDHSTKSMWSTIKGEPVIGPLVGKGIKLPVHNVVNTDWKNWKTQHPNTRVLSLNTGHRRDYGEGVAYRDYFSKDELMFTVPTKDSRLKNKAEVFIVRQHQEHDPLAISAEYLNKNPVYQDKVGKMEFVVATDSGGANRAFESKSYRFRMGESRDELVDESNRIWKVTEKALVASTGNEMLKRLPSHRAFWFGWHAVHPKTRLVQ